MTGFVRFMSFMLIARVSDNSLLIGPRCLQSAEIKCTQLSDLYVKHCLDVKMLQYRVDVCAVSLDRDVPKLEGGF